MKKILPIEKNRLADVTECWTFEKLSIIQASPFSEDWLASHLNIIMHSDYSVSFGDSYYKYSPSYFDDILRAKIINYFQDQNVLDIIISNIDQERYVKYFRWLIYGYDSDTNMFFVLLEKSMGGLNNISFNEAVKRFNTFLKEFGKEDLPSGKENTRLEAAKSFQFPFVTYEINKSYSTDNCPYSALIKIDREIWGNKLIITDCNDENFDGAEVLYDGIACLYGLKNHLTAYITGIDVTNLSSLSKSIKKLHEHRCLLLLSLNYIRKKWNIENDSINNCIKAYGTCCNNVRFWCNMALKYEVTAKTRLLQKIYDCIDSEAEQEKNFS